MNTVQLVGNLAKDPEMQTTNSGLAVTRFTIAVNREVKKGAQSQADFIRIIAWRQLAELAQKYLSKGSKVGVVGRIQTSSYTGQDGQRHYSTDVVADRIEFLTPKGLTSASNSAAAQADAASEANGFTEVTVADDDLLF